MNNPISGQSVSFSKENSCSGSSLSPTSATTNSSCEATTTLTVCCATFTTITVTASMIVSGTTLTEGSIRVAWKPSPDRQVVGHLIYLGTASRWDGCVYRVGSVTEYTINDVEPGMTYYMVLRAYDQLGRVSRPTRKRSVTLSGLTTATATPVPLPTATPVPSAAQPHRLEYPVEQGGLKVAARTTWILPQALGGRGADEVDLLCKTR